MILWFSWFCKISQCIIKLLFQHLLYSSITANKEEEEHLVGNQSVMGTESGIPWDADRVSGIAVLLLGMAQTVKEDRENRGLWWVCGCGLLDDTVLPPVLLGWGVNPASLGSLTLGSVLFMAGMKDEEETPEMLCELSPVQLDSVSVGTITVTVIHHCFLHHSKSSKAVSSGTVCRVLGSHPSSATGLLGHC